MTSDWAGNRGVNISIPLSTFFGRVGELEQLEQWLLAGKRLVTVSGPPGAGKTRLVQQLVEYRLAESPDRFATICFFDLVEAREMRHITDVASRVLGVPLDTPEDTEATLARLGRAIACRGRVLLVFDNFEQLAGHARTTLGQWLGQAPEAYFLVTSRHRLRLPGEQVIQLGPLTLPKEESVGFKDLQKSEAAALYLDRVRSIGSSYVPSDTDAGFIAKIVIRLDGLPLAIELAAARATVLDPRRLLERLNQRFELLTCGSDGFTHHTTLEAAIDWSWSLLAPWEQEALAQCAVFGGGFDLEAAEAVLELSHPDAPNVLDVIQNLCDKCLVATATVHDSPSELRFRLYESIREYAAKRLEESGQLHSIERRHGAYFSEIGLVWADAIDGPQGVLYLRKLGWEEDNLRAVIDRVKHRAEPSRPKTVRHTSKAEQQKINQALRAALALDSKLNIQGRYDTHLMLFDRVFKAIRFDSVVSKRLYVRGLMAKAGVLRILGRYEDGLNLLEKAKDQAKCLDDKQLQARALFLLGMVRYTQGQLEQSQTKFQRAIERFRATKERLWEARAIHCFSVTLFIQARYDRAIENYQKALPIFEEIEARRDIGHILLNLGELQRIKGRVSDAEKCVQRALAIHREFGDRRMEAMSLKLLGAAVADLNRCESARSYFEQALDAYRYIGDRNSEGIALGDLGDLSLEQGELNRARIHLEQAREIHSALNNHLGEAHLLVISADLLWTEGHHEAAVAKLRDTLGTFRQAGEKRLEGLVLAQLGALEALLDRMEQATKNLNNADRIFTDIGDQVSLKVVKLYRGHLDVRLAHHAIEKGDDETADALLAGVRQRMTWSRRPALDKDLQATEAATLYESSFDVRRATSLLTQALPERDQRMARGELMDPERKALLLDTEERQFRPPGGEWTSFSNRPQPFRFLVRLVQQHQNKPAESVSMDELRESAYPGEKMVPKAAASRIYQNMFLLRKHGMANVVLKRQDGYLLDPALTVIQVNQLSTLAV